MENMNGLDCGEDGKPKGIREREQDKALRGHKISHFQTKVGLKKKKKHFLGQSTADNGNMGCYICNEDLCR